MGLLQKIFVTVPVLVQARERYNVSGRGAAGSGPRK